MKNKILLALAAVLPLSLPVYGAATIVINNVNGAGVGFNDPTAVAPVGGNTGTTLGQQRLIADRRARARLLARRPYRPLIADQAPPPAGRGIAPR